MGAASIDGLPPLRDVIERFGLRAKKSLGQNFLLDLNLTSKVARAAGLLTGKTVIEVGPGPGGLTRALLMSDVKKVIAVEKDARCVEALQEVAAHYPGRLDVLPADALDIDLATIANGEKVKVIANLPYNIGTELLIRWLTANDWPPFYESLTLMFQKEVAQRITAGAGDSHYGRLGVLCGWRTEAEMMFDIPPSAFTPAPKVTSTVVSLIPRPHPLDVDLKSLELVSRAAFGQRRKMLRQSLKTLGGDAYLERCGIDGTRRAETLSVAEFARLAGALTGSA